MNKHAKITAFLTATLVSTALSSGAALAITNLSPMALSLPRK